MKPDNQTKHGAVGYPSAPHIAEALARQHALVALHELECAVGGLNGMEKQAVCTALDAMRPMFRKRSVNTAKTTDPIWDSRNDEE